MCIVFTIIIIFAKKKKKKGSWNLESRQGFAGGPNKIERMMIIEA